MKYIFIEKERFFINRNGLVEHKESKTTFNDLAEAEKWVYNIIEEMKGEIKINNKGVFEEW